MEETLRAAARRERGARPSCGREPGDARYSLLDEGQLLTVQERERRVVAVLRQWGRDRLRTARALDVGTGTGAWLRDLVRWGFRPENLVGLELSETRTAQARRLCPSLVTVRCGSAARLDFCDGTFDLVVQSLLFTSVLDPDLRRRIAREMLRVVKPDGMILWYDFRFDNPWNPGVRGVGRREIQALFPATRIRFHAITLAPPLARVIAPWSWLAGYCLGRIPWLCTHYLAVVTHAGDAKARCLPASDAAAGPPAGRAGLRAIT